MNASHILIFVLVAAGVRAQPAGTTPVTQVPTLVYDSRYVKVVGDGRGAPNLPPFTSIPETPIPPGYFSWGPRVFAASGRLKNSAFRASIAIGDEIVGGLVIGDGDRAVLVRAIGPSLTSFGLTGFVARPQLRIFDSAGALVASGVPWSANTLAVRNELKAATLAAGGVPLREGSEDQVLLLFLERGSYTCVVTGIGNSSGVALLETYEVPSIPILGSSSE